MKKRVVNATEFKAKCSAYLDEVEENGGPITILRRGRPDYWCGPRLLLDTYVVIRWMRDSKKLPSSKFVRSMKPSVAISGLSHRSLFQESTN
jgi:hypothetical protein